MSQRALDDEGLLKKIKEIFIASKGRYGSPRVFKSLLAAGIAVGRKRVERFPKDVIVHTDRGIEYTGYLFQETLVKYGLTHSVNRPGHCTDNAFMESFYHSLKAELIRGTSFNSATELRKELKCYINQFYNPVRLHSGLGYMSPMEYEQCLV